MKQINDGVRSFELSRPTCLWTDWSKHGIGFTLLQKFCNCAIENAPTCCANGYKIVFAGSRFTTESESRYAPIEGEALAVAYALEKCRMFVIGCPNLILVVDHKPLVKIFTDKLLEKISNPRLFNLKEKTLMYDFKIKHVAGKLNTCADACSRFPVESSHSSPIVSQPPHPFTYDVFCLPPTNNDVDLAIDIDSIFEATIMAGFAEGDCKLVDINRIKEVSSSDKEINELSQYVINGFPNNINDCSAHIKQFWNIRHDLTTLDGLLLYGTRIIIPRALRMEILENLHSAHQGETGMKARAKTCIYWPGMDGNIRKKRQQCKDCIKMAPSQTPEPMLTSPSPQYPFEQVVSDYFFLNGQKYLLYAERYSGWITIIKPHRNENDAKFLMKQLRTLFCIYGAPNELSSDGGPPYDSHEMFNFLHTWGVHWRKSSAYYPQSNGRAELAVKVAKRILTNNCDPNGNIDNDLVARALLQYRNTPLQELNLSPAQILYGRVLKDHTPSLPELREIRSEWRLQANDRELALQKRNSKIVERYDRISRPLGELDVNDRVAVQNQTGSYPKKWEKTGKIVEKMGNRQYNIRMDGSGRITTRNRRFIKKVLPVCSDPPLPFRRYNNTYDNVDGIYDEPEPSGDNALSGNGDENIVEQSSSPHQSTEIRQDHVQTQDTPKPPEIRRSNRNRVPRELLTINPDGKSHFYETLHKQ